MNDNILLITDGSEDKATSRGGSGVVMRFPDGRVVLLARGYVSTNNYQAEIAAWRMGLVELKLMGYSPSSTAVLILTDPLGAIKLYAYDDSSEYAHDETSSELGNWSLLRFGWCPGHIGFAPHDLADAIAERYKLPGWIEELQQRYDVRDYHYQTNIYREHHAATSQVAQDFVSSLSLVVSADFLVDKHGEKSRIEFIASKINQKAAAGQSGLARKVFIAYSPFLKTVAGPELQRRLDSGFLGEEESNALLRLLYKKGSSSQITNFRTLSLQETPRILVDASLALDFSDFIFKNKLFSEAIKGIRKGQDGVRESAFLAIYTIRDLVRRGVSFQAFFPDMHKFFDTIQHGV